MSLRFRQSLSLFPGVRLNLSGSGASVSFGVPGATLNVGARGATATFGIPGSGLSYRLPLSGNAQSNGPGRATFVAPQAPSVPNRNHFTPSSASIGEIRSAEVGTLTSGNLADFKCLLRDARNRRIMLTDEFHRQVSARDEAYKAYRFGLRFPRHPLLKHRVPTLKSALDAEQLEVEAKAEELSGCYARLTLDLNDQVKDAWQKFQLAHAELSRCKAIWDITSSVSIDRVKSRSSASQSVERKKVSLSSVFSGGEIIASEYNALRFGNANGGALDFFPGVCLIRNDSDDFALIDFMDIDLEYSSTCFVEEGEVPADTSIVSKTWKKTNADGSRDKRFASNYEIPVVVYGELRIKSKTGINEAYMFSSSPAAGNFAIAYLELKISILNMPTFGDEVQQSEKVTIVSDNAVSNKFAVEIPEPPEISSVNWAAIASAVLVAGGATAAGIYTLYRGITITGTARPSVMEVSSIIGPRAPSPNAIQTTVPINIVTHEPTQTFARPTKPEVVPHPTTLIVKTAAKLRSAPSQSASIVRTAKAGEKFNLFGKANGWIQVGTDKPLGWILGTLISDAS